MVCVSDISDGLDCVFGSVGYMRRSIDIPVSQDGSDRFGVDTCDQEFVLKIPSVRCG